MRVGTILLLLIALVPVLDARAEDVQPVTEPSAADPVPRDLYWGQIQGLMLGVAVTHCQQPLAAWLEEDIEFRDKHVISIGGCALYGVSFATAMKRWRPGLWINIIGPAVGITSVTAGWILSETDVIDATVRPDTYQIMGGILQMAALVRSIQLLRAGPPDDRPAALSVDISPSGLTVSGSW
jgi:hypothetical protein